MSQEVEYPNWRKEIKEAIDQLADEEFQNRWWPDLNRAAASGVHINFDQIFHTLFDDIPFFLSEPEETVGSYMKNETEARKVQKLVILLDRLLERYGPLMTPIQAIADRDWKEVVSLAGEAKAEMEKQDMAQL